MPQLIPPSPRLRASFVAAMAEFRAEGRGEDGDDTMLGAEIREFGASWDTPDGFARYIDILRGEAETPRVPGYVPATTLWWADADDYLGRLAIRHRLTPALRASGGHIGYDVRPGARRKGHATAMLRTALPLARGLGIDRALIMCDVDNLGSRKVIEAGGGRFEDEHAGKLRYWIEL
ncbi:MAG TPA: GNAT family N-acetyltransferase [Mycobacteriales bacterium]|nr:GNAT family N-acetyltransferase [Mycobacteriales bacterium]